jgi:hypothetical protein
VGFSYEFARDALLERVDAGALRGVSIGGSKAIRAKR